MSSKGSRLLRYHQRGIGIHICKSLSLMLGLHRIGRIKMQVQGKESRMIPNLGDQESERMKARKGTWELSLVLVNTTRKAHLITKEEAPQSSSACNTKEQKWTYRLATELDLDHTERIPRLISRGTGAQWPLFLELRRTGQRKEISVPGQDSTKPMMPKMQRTAFWFPNLKGNSLKLNEKFLPALQRILQARK
jgi:hypothetical protein